MKKEEGGTSDRGRLPFPPRQDRASREEETEEKGASSRRGKKKVVNVLCRQGDSQQGHQGKEGSGGEAPFGGGIRGRSKGAGDTWSKRDQGKKKG